MERLHRLVDGEKVFLTEEEEIELRQEWDKNEQEKLKTLYIEQRLSKYPSFGEQMDIIFHQGIDVWKSKIQEIKDKYPKPL